MLIQVTMPTLSVINQSQNLILFTLIVDYISKFLVLCHIWYVLFLQRAYSVKILSVKCSISGKKSLRKVVLYNSALLPYKV